MCLKSHSTKAEPLLTYLIDHFISEGKGNSQGSYEPPVPTVRLNQTGEMAGILREKPAAGPARSADERMPSSRCCQLSSKCHRRNPGRQGAVLRGDKETGLTVA